MGSLSISLFGKLCVRRDGREIQGIDACKAQELLSYLLIHRDRPHSREALAGLLWGDTSTEKSRKYLRQALWQLQTALDDEAGGALTVEHDWVQLNSQAGVWLDVATFEQAFTAVQGSGGGDISEHATGLLQEAVRLYRADLLEGWYQDWCLYERERLQNIYLLILDKLMAHCEARHKFELGLLYGSLILRHDRAHERTHRQMMSLQYHSGDRTAALRQYERCAAALQEELGVKPDGRTSALYQQIRDGNVQEARSAPAAEAAPASLAELLGQLRQIQTLLADVQQRVHKDIKDVEFAIDKRR
jgi:DNA-binding SARP family transcriptional activator